MNVYILEEDLEILLRTGRGVGKYKKLGRDKALIKGAAQAYNIMRAVVKTADLRSYSFLHYEQLKYQGDSITGSVRLVNGRVERLIFNETADGFEITLLEIDNTHYGNKK